MTLQDLIDLLLDEARATTPREIAITRAVLLAYELGLAAGRHEAHGQAPQHLISPDVIKGFGHALE